MGSKRLHILTSIPNDPYTTFRKALDHNGYFSNAGLGGWEPGLDGCQRVWIRRGIYIYIILRQELSWWLEGEECTGSTDKSKVASLQYRLVLVKSVGMLGRTAQTQPILFLI